jgi:hypothetical protein
LYTLKKNMGARNLKLAPRHTGEKQESISFESKEESRLPELTLPEETFISQIPELRIYLTRNSSFPLISLEKSYLVLY